MKSTRTILFLLLFVFVSACNSMTPTSTISPTVTLDTSTLETSTPEATAMPTETPIPEATPTAVPTAESGIPEGWSTKILVNDKGESITVPVSPELGDNDKTFEASMQYIADNALWYTSGEDSNSIIGTFWNDPELDQFLAQFEGVPGYLGKPNYWGEALPDRSTSPNRVDFFCLFEGPLGNVTLQVFQRKDGSYQAIYTPMAGKDYGRLTSASPFMLTLHP